jgi:uncharacterized protein
MSWPNTLWMYLSPGVPVLAIYLIGGRWLSDRHQPADLALAAGFLFVAFPIELSRAMRASRAGWTLSGKALPGTAVKPGRRRFLWRALALTAAAFALLLVTSPLSTALASGPLSFLPAFLQPNYDWTTLAQPRAWLACVAVILIVVNGLLIPWVEEIYYRGYLLHRTPGPRWVTVVLGAALFAVEHLWQPQNWPLIAALAIILGWAVYRWRTIWIGYAVHAVANTVGIVVLASQLINR